jgi:hypothetical protein
MAHDLIKLLGGNPYPGRGIVLGRSEDGGRAVLLYFIMGRSANSRNRVFERSERGVRTAAFDPSTMADPSLVIYNAVRVHFGAKTIVTNGDQTDTIYEYLSSRRGFRDALLTREFEPDAPNYTPRISGLLEPDGSYSLSILKTADGDPRCCIRSFFEYSAAIPGLGHFISTYRVQGPGASGQGSGGSGQGSGLSGQGSGFRVQDPGDRLESFEGEPIPVDITVADGLEAFAGAVWDAMDADNKVALYALERDIGSGQFYDLIINKNG